MPPLLNNKLELLETLLSNARNTEEPRVQERGLSSLSSQENTSEPSYVTPEGSQVFETALCVFRKSPSNLLGRFLRIENSRQGHLHRFCSDPPGGNKCLGSPEHPPSAVGIHRRQLLAFRGLPPLEGGSENRESRALLQTLDGRGSFQCAQDPRVPRASKRLPAAGAPPLLLRGPASFSQEGEDRRGKPLLSSIPQTAWL
mmetsp:Transcript_50310/g.99072  ORF Transcript_50310/g.99072 Transcript_50310/m.99072 type:complete len:200 (+) Transcript_50310:1662-2261(+)